MQGDYLTLMLLFSILNHICSCDPLLFPAKASEDLLRKFPPTVVFEVEFDFYITEATRFAR